MHFVLRASKRPASLAALCPASEHQSALVDFELTQTWAGLWETPGQAFAGYCSARSEFGPRYDCIGLKSAGQPLRRHRDAAIQRSSPRPLTIACGHESRLGHAALPVAQSSSMACRWSRSSSTVEATQDAPAATSRSAS